MAQLGGGLQAKIEAEAPAVEPKEQVCSIVSLVLSDYSVVGTSDCLNRATVHELQSDTALAALL